MRPRRGRHGRENDLRRTDAPPGIAEIAPHFPELEILELIGAGGMGAVYKARQPQLDRFVALKILSRHLASDPAFVERFNREARVLGRLSHPNIVGIHDFGTAGPYCYLLMEYVDGVNLRQAMRAGRFTPTEALEMVQHLCSALKFAHEEGILHRDIKPENILIDSKGRIKVADFGIAKLVGEDREHDFTLTLQGSVLGSPHYMAPEQIETPGDVDQRADIYSLGVVLYEMLTGGLPLGRFALPSEKAAMDARIDHIVMRTLEKERDARYQSAGEVGTEVEALGKSPAPPAIKPAALPAEPGAARFSLLAAILTGVSFPLAVIMAVVPAYLFTMRVSESAGHVVQQKGMGVSAGAIVAVLFALPAVVCALIGFILGARALFEIRRSGGAKTGLGTSIFASTAWPILVFLALGQLFMKMPSPGEGGSIGPFLVIIVVILPVVVSAWMLIRSLYRWAGGVKRKDGTRFHPGLGIPVLMAMLLAIGGPVLLAEITAGVLSSSESRGTAETRMGEMMKIPRSVEARASQYDASAEGMMKEMKELKEIVKRMDVVEWENALPEVNFLVLVNANRKVEFQLIRSRSNDPTSPLQTFDIKGLSHDRGAGAGNVSVAHRLFIGTAYSDKHPLSLAAVIQGYETKDSVLDMDFQGWQFEKELPSDLYFAEEGTTEYLIATKDKDKPEIAEQLVLRAVVTAVRK